MSIDCCDGEPVDVYDERIRRAAKEHACDACKETIRRGDLYHRTATLFEGSWDVTNRCARCQAMYNFLYPLVRALGDGDEICAEALDCGHEWKENFEGEPPLAVQALAFLTPAEAQVLLAKNTPRVRGETEDVRIARLLRAILGDRMPVPEQPFVATERADRAY